MTVNVNLLGYKGLDAEGRAVFLHQNGAMYATRFSAGVSNDAGQTEIANLLDAVVSGDVEFAFKGFNVDEPTYYSVQAVREPA
ncbi:hypothetical protein [Pantoea stewartii]|uniref:hypothetical protein n=1 Tax=Pantoea stewartii TaxID=66269 RepID=UPI001980E254|nr:hypothetical protein [Pantoea stewartii]